MYARFCGDVRLSFVAGVIENWLHTRRLSRISVRIHVNGTRGGKSTITRLIAAGLRAGGMRVIAKTTGTAARIIFEDGSEEPVVRRGNCANISEQMRLVKLAESRGGRRDSRGVHGTSA